METWEKLEASVNTDKLLEIETFKGSYNFIERSNYSGLPA